MSEPGTQESSASSPYASGGGGVVFEHQFGATLLAALLAGSPVTLFGDAFLVDQVSFQAKHLSPVDDIVVDGRVGGPAETAIRVVIGVRHRPTIGKSDDDFVALLANMLAVVRENWEDVRSGRLCIGLVVAGPIGAVEEMAALSTLARGHPSATDFKAAVVRPRATTSNARTRLATLKQAVEAADSGRSDGPAVDELTWRLLCGLHVALVRIEGETAPDRGACIALLQSVTTRAADAVELHTKLEQLASRYVPAGAQVTDALLRHDLVGLVPIVRSSRYPSAWPLLDGLADRLRRRTRQLLRAGDTELQIDRSELRSGLLAALSSATQEEWVLIVTGEPDVGKSALAVAAVDELVAAGAAVSLLSLRDLPVRTGQLEHELGGRLSEVLGATAVGTTRVLLAGGAEAVLEGWSKVFADLVAAASTVGLQMLIVVRRDAAPAVEASVATAGGTSVSFDVPPFRQDEASRVANSFDSLARAAADPRSVWLLRRPGLVDLVLRAGGGTRLASGPLSEADVFAAVWSGLVRRGEVHGPGEPSPDGREQALVALVKRALTGSQSVPIPDVSVLPSLRSDGLLLDAGPTVAWSSGDQFASDLVRDYALARLFLTEGFALLAENGAPRWAIRATLVALQARLLATADTTATRRELQKSMDDLAGNEGARWSELVPEAILTLGSSKQLLEGSWPDLVADRGAGLQRLLRLVEQRYTELTGSDPLVSEPVINLCLDHLGELASLPDDVVKAVTRATTSFLRGLVMSRPDETNSTRLRLRELTLLAPLKPRSGAVERLGLLDIDFDDRADAALRRLADEEPFRLDRIVERAVAVRSLALHRPELLLTLAETYYIEKRTPGKDWSWTPLDGGVRDHRLPWVRHPFAGSYFGPFQWLLRRLPVETIAFINRLLDHAATIRGDHMAGGSGDSGANLELPQIGSRWLAGDSHVWSWYRGTGVGPYPCVSALLALEAAADSWYEAGNSLDEVAQALLRDCHNLAVASMVVGFLIRHVDEVQDELDVFLAQPLVWSLEFSRMVGEHGLFHAQRDDPEVHGFANRKYSLREAAGILTVEAMTKGDLARIATLENIADRLVASATGSDGHVDPEVVGWAAGLRAASYKQMTLQDGTTVIQAKAPTEVEQVLEERRSALNLVNEGYRLLNTYARDPERRPADISTLAADLDLARQIIETPAEPRDRSPVDAAAAVAAAAVISYVEAGLVLDPKALAWALSAVIYAATPVSMSLFDVYSSWYEQGADRSAATALPFLLLPPFNEDRGDVRFDDEDFEVVNAAISAVAGSHFDEVRRAFGKSVAVVWSAPCGEVLGDQCRHVITLNAVDQSLRDCRFGAWGGQRRLPLPIAGDLETELPTIDGDDLLIDRLTGPIVALASAALSKSCIADRARTLLDVVIAAHRRAAVAWAGQGYEMADRGQVPVVTALVDLYTAGHPQNLDEHLRALIDDPEALWQILRLLAELATYDADRRPSILALWPHIMVVVMDEIDAGHDPRHTGTGRSGFRRGDAMAALVPHPQLTLSDADPNTTLDAASSSWLGLGETRDAIERWLPFGVGLDAALDSLLAYLRTLPQSEQVSPGLTWVTTLIGDDYRGLRGRSFHLPTWLRELRSGGVIEGEPLRRFRAIVDGFANAGDSRFVEIQRSEEGDIG